MKGLKEITSKHNSDFYCLNCLYSFGTENKCKSRKKVCENKDFFNVTMASEDITILEFNQYQKSDKAPFAIYADLEYLIEKIDLCKNNPERFCNVTIAFEDITILEFNQYQKSDKAPFFIYADLECLKEKIDLC